MMFNLRLNHRKPKLFLLIPLLLLMAASTGIGQTNTFTYQGRLTDGGTPATGIYDFQFSLFDAAAGGAQQGPLNVWPGVTVTNGVFTVHLNFGTTLSFPNNFPGADRYLEIAMRHPNDAAYTTLSPRQQLNSTPYAIRSASAASADTADNATQLATQLSSPGTINTSSNPVDWTELKNVPSFVNGGYSAGNGISINGTTLSNTGVLTVDASGPLSSSGGPNPNIALSGVVPVANGGTGTTTQNFVDLSTNQSILGNKTFTSAVNTSTQYNIGGERVLSVGGLGNVFAGVGAGQINTGLANSFFGASAGVLNITGSNNAFFGASAGYSNVGDPNDSGSGSFNSFFGAGAGLANTTGYDNSFFGTSAGAQNKMGSGNAFFGVSAGENNTTGCCNTFTGFLAGHGNYDGDNNTAIGYFAGLKLSPGNNNNIYIANQGANESNTIRIGTSGTQTQTFIAGINGVNVGPAAQVFVNANGQLGTVASSRRFKENIRDMGANSSDLLRLRPVTFLYKPEYSQGPRTLQYGLIAEEVAKVNPTLVAYAKDGTPYTVQYHLLTPMLLNEVQKQNRQLHTQELQLNAQTRQINIQAQQVKAQAQQLADLTARLARVEAQQAHRRYRRQQPKRSRL